MPIIQSAKKQLKQNKKKKSRNDHFKALFTESRKAFEKAVKESDAKAAREVLVNKKNKEGITIKA
jgi:ribosomal protein S20